MTAQHAGKSRDEIAAAYDSPPWWYDIRGFLILTFAYNSTLGRQLRFFGPNFGDEHLEVACGTGTLLELVLRWRKRKRGCLECIWWVSTMRNRCSPGPDIASEASRISKYVTPTQRIFLTRRPLSIPPTSPTRSIAFPTWMAHCGRSSGS